ncbi:hydroxymethylpyrimidine ABC-type transporter, substrate-binding component [Moraxella macacae 0408225]|uniref:Thiamine pyrimidine synthase n=1 Tax=Moraxella macacae 0408225 TaxID=1230338 RepID=L2F5I0_9GAMM|nr:ABC transporter substrate-binding protein [Moraxella macacae]ELA08140.1 hydroxymethylpyrimidine ABC-type transporter, substrate-binding component [Moraxella macacae 0408225]
MTKLNIALEWFLNPDHLPMIAGIKTGAYAKAGLDVNMTAPDDHYDGFHALEKGEIDLHTNEPLHLFEHYAPNLRALGCFFATDGGILMRKSSMHKLQSGETIKICTPSAAPKTNKIGFEILRRYAKTQNIELNSSKVEFIEMDFHHIDNLQNNAQLDGAWLCFYNFEGVEAKHKGLEFVFIDQNNTPYANFSALEFITTEQILIEKKDAIKTFIEITSQMVTFCQNNPDKAKAIYYDYSGEEQSALMDAIIDDTLPRLISPISADSARWQKVREMLAQLDIVALSDEEYKGIFAH